MRLTIKYHLNIFCISHRNKPNIKSNYRLQRSRDVKQQIRTYLQLDSTAPFFLPWQGIESGKRTSSSPTPHHSWTRERVSFLRPASIEELKGTFKRNTVYDLEQSMEVKLENLPGLTSSTKPHCAGWTPWSARLIVQQSMMV